MEEDRAIAGCYVLRQPHPFTPKIVATQKRPNTGGEGAAVVLSLSMQEEEERPALVTEGGREGDSCGCSLAHMAKERILLNYPLFE